MNERGKAERQGGHEEGFRIKVDGETFVAPKALMTGGEILELAGRLPVEAFGLFQRVHGGKTEKVEYDETVNLAAPGVEHFSTLHIQQTDGLGSRRDFRLPPDDEAFLDALGLPWEAVSEDGVQRVVVYGRRVPVGYTIAEVDLYLRIESGYPDAQIDTVYFHPALARADGQAIRRTSDEAFDGRTWQRWSRHRTREHPWRSGIDNISTHLALVDEWLAREPHR